MKEYLDTDVIIVAKNEKGSIIKVIDEVNAAMKTNLLVVCGDKETYDLVCDKAKHHNLTIVYNYGDRGKGHALLHGIKITKSKFVVNIDADMQFAASDIPRLVDVLREGNCEMCHGSRFMKLSDRSAYKGEFIRYAGNKLLALAASLLTRTWLTDVTAGLKAWRREYLEKNLFRHEGFFYDFELTVRSRFTGGRIREIPIQYRSREDGVSLMGATNLSLIKSGLSYLAYGVKVYLESYIQRILRKEFPILSKTCLTKRDCTYR